MHGWKIDRQEGLYGRSWDDSIQSTTQPEGIVPGSCLDTSKVHVICHIK